MTHDHARTGSTGRRGIAQRMLRPFAADDPLFHERTAAPPAWLWLGLPLGFAAVSLILRAVDPDAFAHWINSEYGFGENLTAVLFAATAPLAFALARADGLRRLRWPSLGLYVVAGLAVLVAGEEWSWGQHFFRWGTPEWVAAVNKQNETNLHNMADRALDQKPRAIIAAVIFIGAVVLPLLRRAGQLRWLDRYPVAAWLLPGATLVPAGLLVFAPRILDRLQVWFGVVLPPPFDLSTRHHQELQETSIAIAVFLYFLTLYLRVRAARRAQTTP